MNDYEVENLLIKLRAETEQYKKEMVLARKVTDDVDETLKNTQKSFKLFDYTIVKVQQTAHKIVQGFDSMVRGVKNFGYSFMRMGDEIVSAAGTIAGVIGADIIVDSLGAFLGWLKEGATGARKTALSLEDLSDTLGVSVEKAAALKWYSDRTGISMDKLRKNIDMMPESVRKWASSAGKAHLLMTQAEVDAAKMYHTAFDSLIHTVQRIGQQLSYAIFPILTEWANQMRELAQIVLEFVVNNRELIKTVFTWAVKAASMGGTIWMIGKAFTYVGTALGFLTPIISILTGLFTTMTTVLLGLPLPLLLLLGAGVAVGAMFVDWKTQIPQAVDSVKRTFWDLWNSAKRVFMDIKQEAMDSFGAIINSLRGGDFATAGKVAWAFLYLEWVRGSNAIIGVWNAVKDYFMSAWEDAKNYFMDIWEMLPRWSISIWGSPIETFKTMWNVAWAQVKLWGIEAMLSIVNMLHKATQQIMKVVMWMFENLNIGAILSAAVGAILDAIHYISRGFFEAFAAIGRLLLDVFVEVLPVIFDMITTGFKGVFAWLAQQLGDFLIKRVGEAMKAAGEMIKSTGVWGAEKLGNALVSGGGGMMNLAQGAAYDSGISVGKDIYDKVSHLLDAANKTGEKSAEEASNAIGEAWHLGMGPVYRGLSRFDEALAVSTAGLLQQKNAAEKELEAAKKTYDEVVKPGMQLTPEEQSSMSEERQQAAKAAREAREKAAKEAVDARQKDFDAAQAALKEAVAQGNAVAGKQGTPADFTQGDFQKIRKEMGIWGSGGGGLASGGGGMGMGAFVKGALDTQIAYESYQNAFRVEGKDIWKNPNMQGGKGDKDKASEKLDATNEWLRQLVDIAKQTPDNVFESAGVES